MLINNVNILIRAWWLGSQFDHVNSCDVDFNAERLVGVVDSQVFAIEELLNVISR